VIMYIGNSCHIITGLLSACCCFVWWL
jgi:hypothetical protein